jgi:hypothetical protein
MGTNVIVSGVTYNVPSYGDTGWGQGQNSVNNLLIALAAAIANAPAFLQFTLVQSTPTTAITGRTFLIDTSSVPITINLPMPAANFWFIVKDKRGTFFANPVTLHRFASELIDGVAADATLKAPYGSWTFFSDGTDWYSVNYV